jgi:hypothetical protein
VNQGSHVLVKCITANIRLLANMFEEGAENDFLQLADMHQIQQTCSLHVEVGRKNTDILF